MCFCLMFHMYLQSGSRAARPAVGALLTRLRGRPDAIAHNVLLSHKSQSSALSAAVPPDPAAGTLLAGLRGRQDAIAAAGLATAALDGATQAAWATARPLQPGSFAAALCAYAIDLVGGLRCV